LKTPKTHKIQGIFQLVDPATKTKVLETYE